MGDKPMSKIELKPGDFVRVFGQSEETLKALKAQFIEAGAIDHGNTGVSQDKPWLWWDYRDDELLTVSDTVISNHTKDRQQVFTLTVEQVLGISNKDSRHPQYDLIEKYYREWGEWDAGFVDFEGVWTEVGKPSWAESFVWELRPRKKIMHIGNYKFPEPEREAPEDETTYYLVDKTAEKLIRKWEWGGDQMDMLWLKRGLIHLSESAAIAHAKAEIKASGGEVDGT
jgi:hypothetical protein